MTFITVALLGCLASFSLTDAASAAPSIGVGGFLEKAFLGDPTAPGSTVTLEFTLINRDRFDPATNITFTDDLGAVVPGLVAVGLPLMNPCGPGSQLTGTSLLTLTGGSLAPEASCTFNVTLQVPAGASSGTFTNTTSSPTYLLRGSTVTEAPATDDLTIAPVPVLTKSFLTDPALPGGSETLRFTLTNSSPTDPATDLAFTDDLGAALPGLAAVGLPQNDVCGAGSQISGTTLLSFTGGNLPAGGSCTFDITLAVPANAQLGLYTNTTSQVTGMVGGNPVVGSAATDTLSVVGAPSLQKAFLGDPVPVGTTVVLELTLSLPEQAPAGATAITFTDDLGAVLPGLTAIGLPLNDVCGAGSQISGTTLLTFTGGSLAPGGECTFSVTLQVPAGAAAGSHPNTTSPVLAMMLGQSVTGTAASDDLDILAFTMTKSFINDPVVAGGTVTLRFTLTSLNATDSLTAITFTDNLTATLSGLSALGLPANDVCGAGSQISGTTTLSFTGGSLAPSANCVVDVALQVPAGAAPGEYVNVTSPVSAMVAGNPVSIAGASDSLLVSDALSIAKSFTDDPAVAGGTVTLEFTINNFDTGQPAAGLTFTDDLDATLSGLVAVGLPLANVCGAGSQIAGTSLLTLTGGNLPAGGSCTFSVTLQVPLGVPAGTMAVNTTSTLSGTVGGVGATGQPATDTLIIEVAGFSKAFAGLVGAGGTVVLSFTLENLNPGSGLSGLSFLDDLSAVLPGLVATGLPAANVCGPGSSLTGSSLLSFSNGSLGPGSSCTFNVTLQVPAGATPGTYANTTSDLLLAGVSIATPATAQLGIEPPPTFSKAFAPDSIGVNGVSMLTFVIDNTASALAASALSFTDNLPAGVVVATPANASTTCTGGTLTAVAGSGTISYTGGSVAAGDSCTVLVNVTATTPGVLVNTSGVLTSSSGSSGTATDSLTVNPQPSFAKAFLPDVIPPGGTAVLAFTVGNTGSTVAATGLDFTDNLPAGMVVASPANASTTCGGGTLTAAAGSGVVSYSGGTLPAGASCSVMVDVTSAAVGTSVNTSGALSSSLGSSGTATASLAISGSGSIFLTKSFANPAPRGGLVDLAFTITNPSAAAGLTGIAFTDDLTAVVPGLAAVGLPLADVCGAGSSISGTTILTFTGGSLGPGATCSFTVTLSVPLSAVPGNFTNTTSVVTGTRSDVPVEGAVANADLTIEAAPIEVPALGTWGLLALAAAMAGAALLVLRRR
ncbi:MAG TPA: hypothetical protein VF017_24055 [Thermoanaerobaculia bacterium]|nr:hypothetical protein [Thermoanaerobaculia bacterium]